MLIMIEYSETAKVCLLGIGQLLDMLLSIFSIIWIYFFFVYDRLLIKYISEKICYFDSDEATSLCLLSLLWWCYSASCLKHYLIGSVSQHSLTNTAK